MVPPCLPVPQIDEQLSERVEIDHHLVTSSLFIAIISFTMDFPNRTNWVVNTKRSLRKMTDTGKTVEKVAQIGYRRMTLGALVTTLLLIFGDPSPFFFVHSWTFLRAPLLVAVGYTCFGHALVFRQIAEQK